MTAQPSATAPALLYLLHKPHGCGECRYCRSKYLPLQSSATAPASPKAPTAGTLLHAIHGVMQSLHSPQPRGLYGRQNGAWNNNKKPWENQGIAILRQRHEFIREHWQAFEFQSLRVLHCEIFRLHQAKDFLPFDLSLAAHPYSIPEAHAFYPMC